MSFVKYRVKEVAADFGVTPKDIAEIVGKYFEKPRSNTQVLTDEQLNVVFDVITQKHQIASLEQVFAVAPQAKKPEPKKAEAPKPAAQPAQQQPFLQSAGQHGSGHSRPHCRRHTGHRPHCGQWQPCMRQQKRRQRQQQYAHAHTAAKGQQQRRRGRIFNTDFCFAQIFSHNKTPPCTVNTMQGGVGFMSITS